MTKSEWFKGALQCRNRLEAWRWYWSEVRRLKKLGYSTEQAWIQTMDELWHFSGYYNEAVRDKIHRLYQVKNRGWVVPKLPGSTLGPPDLLEEMGKMWEEICLPGMVVFGKVDYRTNKSGEVVKVYDFGYRGSSKDKQPLTLGQHA